LFKIQPSPAAPSPKSKKKAWICLDSLVRIEPFQRVALTPQGKKSWSRSIPLQWPRKACAFVPEHPAKVTRASDFDKQNAWAKFGGHGGGIGVSLSPRGQGDSVETRHSPV
jgi:hypothetical protein